MPDKKLHAEIRQNAFWNCQTNLIILGDYKRSGSKLFTILASSNAFAEAFVVLYCIKNGSVKEYLLFVVLISVKQ